MSVYIKLLLTFTIAFMTSSIVFAVVDGAYTYYEPAWAEVTRKVCGYVLIISFFGGVATALIAVWTSGVRG